MSSFQMACENSPLVLSDTYILPENLRPQLNEVVSNSVSIPVIDLKDHDHSNLVLEIGKACENYGFFHVINHGVSRELCEKMLTSVDDFFHLTSEEKKKYLTKDHSKKVKIFNYYYKVEENQHIKMWSETFTHPWGPLDDFSHLLPQNPPQYRETFAEYAREIGGLMDRLLKLISRSLGLEEDCLKRRIGETPSLSSQSNYYPPCPEPGLTMGLREHNDLGVITVLLQSDWVSGLQVINDGKWTTVHPIPGSLVVNLADQLQVLTNGKYKSIEHRAVTNILKPRMSLALFYAPNDKTEIGPVKECIDKDHPPLYRSYLYNEFMEKFYSQEGKRRRVKEAFELPR